MNPRSKKKKKICHSICLGFCAQSKFGTITCVFRLSSGVTCNAQEHPCSKPCKKKCGHQGHLTRCECWSTYIIKSTPHYASKLGIFRYAEQMLSRANFVGRIMLIHIDRNHHLHGCCCTLHAQHGKSDFLPKTFPLHCPCSARLSSTRNRRKQPGPVSKDGEMWNHVTADIDVQGI